VDVYADGAFLLTTPADQFRQDLLNAGKGNGAHGFGFATPNSVKNGTPRSIAVRFAGTQVNLFATPKTINCAPAVSLSGTITYEGGPLSGAAVAGSNGAVCTSTNASGEYTCTVAPGWSGTVIPSMTDRVFTPASRSYTSVTAAQSAQDYTANATFYQVSGTVTLNGLALPNVAMAATGGPTCTTSNGAGQYSCTVPFNWTGSVTPSATGYSFGPANRSYTSVAANQTAQTFTASLDTATAPLYFVHVDHLNTPRLVTNDQQQPVWRWEQQEPFGVNAPDENPSSLGMFEFPLRLPGQYADKETSLFFNYFRDYDPSAGLYIESDPIGLGGGLNTYAYVLSDPLRGVDPKGLTTTVPGPGGIPIPVPTPPVHQYPSQTKPGSGGGLVPPEFDPNWRPQSPKGTPIIVSDPLPPVSPKPPGQGCSSAYDACVRSAQLCPGIVLRGTLYSMCFAFWLICEAAGF
jgi:RHS repeat-associated protein